MYTCTHIHFRVFFLRKNSPQHNKLADIIFEFNIAATGNATILFTFLLVRFTHNKCGTLIKSGMPSRAFPTPHPLFASHPHTPSPNFGGFSPVKNAGSPPPERVEISHRGAKLLSGPRCFCSVMNSVCTN